MSQWVSQFPSQTVLQRCVRSNWWVLHPDKARTNNMLIFDALEWLLLFAWNNGPLLFLIGYFYWGLSTIR